MEGSRGFLHPGWAGALLRPQRVAARPASYGACCRQNGLPVCGILRAVFPMVRGRNQDRKSTRLNSSHTVISYAVFCLKKKKTMCDEGRLVVRCASVPSPDAVHVAA